MTADAAPTAFPAGRDSAGAPRSAAPAPPRPARPLPWFALVAAAALAAYARSCDAPFQFDDDVFLHAQERGQFDTLGGFVGFARTRLLPVGTWVVNHWTGGDDPWGYHAVNIALHLLATFLVFQLARALCDTPRLRDTWLPPHRLPFAVAAAALFACHPIQVQAVTYVAQRATVMAAAFYLGAVLCYVRARTAELGLAPGPATLWFVSSVVLALAAFASKENAISLPLAILLTEWVFFGSARLGRAVLRLGPYAILALGIPLLWKTLGTGRGGARVAGTFAEQVGGLVDLLVYRANPSGGVSPVQYFYTQCTVIPRYLALVVLPFGLNVDHDAAVQRAFTAQVAAGLAALVALLVAGVYAVRRAPVLGFAVLWCAVTLSVESSVLPLRDVMVEHRMYLAMPGIALAAGYGCARLFRAVPSTAIALGATAAVALVASTIHRNDLWRDPVALWGDAQRKSPGKARVYVNTGAALQRAGRLDEAVRAYCRGLALDPKNRIARENLDAAVEAQAEARLEGGEEVSLEGLGDASGAALRLGAGDPCSKP